MCSRRPVNVLLHSVLTAVMSSIVLESGPDLSQQVKGFDANFTKLLCSLSVTRLHRMHEMLTIVTGVRDICLSVCLSHG